MKRFHSIAVLLLPLFFSACALVQSSEPKMTQLQLRQLQTREYDAPKQIVLEAAVAVLHDEGYIIKSADSGLGILLGTKDVNVEPGWAKVFSFFEDNDNSLEQWDKTRIHEISINVQQFGKNSKVRIISQVKTYNNNDIVSDVHQVRSELFYTDIFSKIDKGVFLRKQDL